MTRRWTGDRGGSAGFTLVELLMSVSLMGVVGLTMASLVFVVARTGVPEQNRLQQDNEIMLTSTFFAQDVAGSTPMSILANAVVPNCSPATAVLIQMVPVNPADTTLQYVYYVQSGPLLYRAECHKSSGGVWTTNSITAMSHLGGSLTPACFLNGAAASCPTSSGADVTAVGLAGNLSMNWQAGTTTSSFTLYGSRRVT